MAMNTTDQIATYRAAAVKVVMAAEHLLPMRTPEGQAVGYLVDFDFCFSEPDSWRWLVAAAQLRLLAEALVLEQAERAESPRRDAWRVNLEYQAELGSLVRETLSGEAT